MNRLLLFQVALLLTSTAFGLVIPERAQTARGRLIEALSSPSGKLTLSPEIKIPDPSDPTAILLQSSLITAMSEKMRTRAKANAVFLSGGIAALKTFCNEQEIARGNFPGPLPLVYCDKIENMSEVVDAGAEAILVSVCDAKEITSPDDLSNDSKWSEACKSALENGLQPIPEIFISESTAESWTGSEIEAVISKIAELTGDEPVSILMTVNRQVQDEEDESEEAVDEQEISLPQIPKSLGKKIPILASIRSKAGEGRMSQDAARFKSAGFVGAVLREECIPQLSLSQDLEYLSSFWSACIGDLKSTKSKSFNFRSKNNMEKDLAMEWAKYQMDVIQSGALGEQEQVPMGLNPDAGDYQGF